MPVVLEKNSQFTIVGYTCVQTTLHYKYKVINIIVNIDTVCLTCACLIMIRAVWVRDWHSFYRLVFRFSAVLAVIYDAKFNTWTTKKREFVQNVIKISSEVRTLYLKDNFTFVVNWPNYTHHFVYVTSSLLQTCTLSFGSEQDDVCNGP